MGGLIQQVYMMKTAKRAEQLKQQYQRLKNSLARIGPICQGTAIERSYHRNVKGKRTLYGPYYSWTRKVANRTVTVALSSTQYRHIARAIATRRKVDDILKQMGVISEELITLQIPGVTSRKAN